MVGFIEMNNYFFIPEKFLKFKQACEEAILLNNSHFSFENKNFLVKYAKLVIEDLEEKLINKA